ncbi:hypothetical protein DVF23_25065 [Salmonella enterica subsp. enterica serovar Teko]|nr:hypothetical protein [Salmonella enterica subsp. enterica serovar Teko]
MNNRFNRYIISIIKPETPTPLFCGCITTEKLHTNIVNSEFRYHREKICPYVQIPGDIPCPTSPITITEAIVPEIKDIICCDNLDVAFGQRPTINPLTARLTGNVAGGMKVFNRCGWQAEPDSGTSLPHQYSLMAGQGVPGKGD